ncbi:MAG: hypothetical protein K2Z80_37495 [Xanthobacteraceae bacterium]|nr:hypothetical protein [Xanthobacteraceae bacterium]
MRYLLLLGLLVFGAYKALQDIWYFVRDPSEMQAPLYTRTPAIDLLDGSAFECISRVEEWRKALPHTKPTCQVVPAYRHWFAELQRQIGADARPSRAQNPNP